MQESDSAREHSQPLPILVSLMEDLAPIERCEGEHRQRNQPKQAC